MPAEQDQDVAADFEHDHERQEQARYAVCSHVSRRTRVTADLAETRYQEQQDQEQPAEQVGTVGERFHVESPIVEEAEGCTCRRLTAPARDRTTTLRWARWPGCPTHWARRSRTRRHPPAGCGHPPGRGPWRRAATASVRHPGGTKPSRSKTSGSRTDSRPGAP